LHHNFEVQSGGKAKKQIVPKIRNEYLRLIHEYFSSSKEEAAVLPNKLNH
jgi:hypothetical protein